MTFLPGPGLLSTTLHQRRPPQTRGLYQQGRGPVFLDQTLTSSSSLAASLARLPEKPQVSRRSGVTPGHPLPARALTAALPGLLTSAYRPMGPSECSRSADLPFTHLPSTQL